MSLCKGGNFTIIVKVIGISGLMEIKNNRITGQYGRFADKSLETKTGERDCKLVPVLEFGLQLTNKSWTGALGMLQRREGDIYYSPSSQNFIKDFIEHSEVVMSEEYKAGHQIEKNRKSKIVDMAIMASNLYFETNIRFFVFICTAIFILILTILIYLITSKLQIHKLILNFFRFKYDYKHPANLIGLSLVFYHLFYFLFKLIVSSQISNQKVLVETSYLINSMEMLLKSDYIVCWLKNDLELGLAQQSPENSNMKRVFNERKYSSLVKDMEGEESDHCLLSLKAVGQSFDLVNKCLLINEAAIFGFLTSFVAPDPDIDYWISQNAIIETLSVYYRRKGLSYWRKKIIDNSNQLLMQSGLGEHVYEETIRHAKKTISGVIKFYQDLPSYIKENTIFVNLDFNFLARVFALFLIVQCIILLVFLSNRCLRSFLASSQKYNRHRFRSRPSLNVHYNVYSTIYRN